MLVSRQSVPAGLSGEAQQVESSGSQVVEAQDVEDIDLDGGNLDYL